MLSYSEFKKKEKTGNTIVSYSSFLEKKKEKDRLANVPAEKAQRIEQGLPTSVFSSRAEPNIVESIVQAPLRLGADVLTNVENSLRAVAGKEKIKVVKNKWLGDIKGLGEIDINKSPFDKENLKVILNSASTGAELASYLTAGGVAKDTVAGLTARGVLASKNTFAEWVVKQFPKLAKEGFIQGLAYTAGSQGREYVATGTKPSLGQAVTDVALSTVGSVAIPAVLQKTFGTSGKKILTARETERAIADARILGRKVPDVATKFDNVPKPSAGNILDNNFNPKSEINTPDIKVNEGAVGLTPEVKPRNALELRATRAATKEDFINNEVSFLTRTKQKVTDKAVKEANKAWDNMHPKPEFPKTYSVPRKTAPTPAPTPTTTKPFLTAKEFAEQKSGITSTTSPTQTIPKVENQILKDVERLADEVEGFEPGKFIEWSQEIRKLDPEEITNVAMGGKKTIDNNIPANAYLSIAKNLAEESGDIKMVKELASSNVASKTGQGLVASKLTTTGNIVDDLREVVLQKLRNKKLDETKLTQEQNALFKKVKDRLTEFTQTTKQEVDNIISSLICK